jgi:predicted nucleotidyltransferase component of viral defense system
MLFYELDRDSVDLDFDLLDVNKAEFVHEKIKEIVSRYGEVVETAIGKSTMVNTISYEKGRPTLKVEINKRDYGSKYELKNFSGIPMLVMIKEDLFANKLVAMHERMGKTVRDMYDVNFFFHKIVQPNVKIIESRTGLAYATFLEKCISGVDTFDNKNILNGLGELLSGPQKDSVKVKLKSDLLFNLKLALHILLDPRNNIQDEIG